MQKRIIFLVLVSVLIILVSVGIISNFIVRDSIEHSLDSRLTLASIIGQNIDYILESNLTRLHDISLSAKVDLNDGDWEPEKRALRTAYEYSIFTDGIFLMDNTGNVVATYPHKDEGGINLMGIPYVGRTLTERRPVVSDVYEISPTKKKVIFVLVPLKDKDGEVIGVAGGEINPANYMFTSILKSTPSGKDTLIELIDSHGTIISSTDQARILTNSDHDRFLGNLIRERQNTVSMCHRCHLEDVSAPKRTDDMLAFASLSLAPWGVSVREPQSHVFAPTTTLKKVFTILSLIYIATAVLLAVGLSRSIVKPIRLIIGATKKIARGNLSEPVEYASSDELGALAESVDGMRLKLAEYMDALQSYNEELERRVENRTTELQQRKMQLTSLLDEVMRAQEDERKRIARELHDETSQSLAALGMSLDIAIMALRENKLTPDMIKEQKVKVEQLVRGIRRLIHDLRPPVLDDLGFESAVRWLLERHLADRGIKYYLISCDRFRGPGGSFIDKKTELTLFRIIQEAVTNVAKHSGAEAVSVTLSCGDDVVEIDVMDDGVGFDPEEIFRAADVGVNKGFGILGMRERISNLEGELNIYSQPGEGTHMSVVIPLSVLVRRTSDQDTYS
ncbi:MAG: cache domain-containing protein [Nitrospirota bacterium]|jgi:signal transduction histidine kinase